MVRRGCRPGPLVVALVATLVAAPAAQAISPKRAARVALKTLAPAEDPGPVVVYRMPGKVGAGRTILEDGLGDVPASRAAGKSSTVTVPRLRRPVHLFWADLDPGARFEHAGRLVLVDDRTGRVARSVATSWWPIVDGKDPPFIARRTVPRRLVVYSSVSKPTTAAAVATPRQAPAVGKADFAKDCMFMMGLQRDPQFAKDFVNMQGAMTSIGVRTFTTGVHTDTTGQDIVDPDGADMRAAMNSMPADCEDILIYLSGHGSEDGEPRVNVGHRFKGAGVDVQEGKRYRVISRYVYAQDLVGIVEDHPGRTFKIKIDACYAGRFIEALDLPNHKNLLVVEASSSSTEVSYSDLGASVRVKDGKRVKEGGTLVSVPYSNDGMGEFSNGNLLTIDRFTTSQAEVDAARAKGGSLLARMLERSIALGRDADVAATAGLTHPQAATNLPGGPAPPPAQPFEVGLQGGYSHQAVDATHPSRVCGKVTTNPPQAGGTARVTVYDGGSGGPKIFDADVTLGADGTATFVAGIDHYGTYTIEVSAPGASGSRTTTVNVTADPGTCP